MKARIITLIIAAFVGIGSLGAQNRWALKTNLLHDATASVNLAVEWGFAPHWSAEVSGSLNKWQLPEGLSLKHAIVQPELRYWFCFPNLKTFYLQKAWMMGGGLGFGYDFILTRHLNLELEMGLGYMYVTGDEYSDGVLILQGSKFDYLGPTRLAVTISYLF